MTPSTPYPVALTVRVEDLRVTQARHDERLTGLQADIDSIWGAMRRIEGKVDSLIRAIVGMAIMFAIGSASLVAVLLR